MKKTTLYLLWTFLCLHTTVSFSEAATTTIDDALAEIDAIISESVSSTGSSEQVSVDTLVSDDTGSESAESTLELDSAPIQYMQPANIIQPTLTSWELIHRTAMLQGFAWGQPTANFITPAMYIGTPLQTNMNTIGYTLDMGATNYSECIRLETDISFGVDGEIMEETVEDEIRSIAKYCATEYLSPYFRGKEYTTREEMLMFIFTLFDEEIYLPGNFDDTEFVFDGEETETAYSNVSAQAWYAPYLSLAYDLIMVADEGTWTVAREVTDEDIEMMFEMYLMDEEGQATDTIETKHGTYTIWYDELGLAIEKTHSENMALYSAPAEDSVLAKEEIMADDDKVSISDEDILNELFSAE